MKHLKSFVSISGTSIDFPYVNRIDVSIKHLNTLHHEGYDFKKHRYGGHIILKGDIEEDLVTISLFEDEWFFVTIYKPSTWNVDAQYYYYKCDQIEGVIDCLKSIYK